MKLSISCILFLLITVKSLSQEREYIVTKKNDTIYGKITRGTNWIEPSKIIYKIKKNKEKRTLINPNEVKVIRSLDGVDGDCYIYVAYSDSYVKKIIDGRIKVYISIYSSLYFTSKYGNEIQFIDFGGFGSRKKAHSEIRSLIKDDSDILKEFDSLKGSAKNILYIIKKYNED